MIETIRGTNHLRNLATEKIEEDMMADRDTTVVRDVIRALEGGTTEIETWVETIANELVSIAMEEDQGEKEMTTEDD